MKLSNILGKIIFFLILPIFLIATPTLTLKVSEDKVYVSQTIKTTLILKYKKEDKILNIDFDEFISKDFWIKDIDESDEINKDDYIYRILTFHLAPQKSGTLTIDKQLLRVSHREYKTNLIKWNNFYTKPKDIEVLPLPENLIIQGKYSISALVDKNKIDANKPINLTLVLEGYGNFIDIEPFDLNISKQLVYNSKPNIITNFDKNKNKGKFIQKFSIIADKDFTIPSITFKYFNRVKKDTVTIKTKPIKIKILNIVNTKISNGDNFTLKYIYLAIGILIGIMIYFIYTKYINLKKEKRDEQPLIKKIKKAKSDKLLYEILLPYSSNTDIGNIMKKLEENIYKNSKNKIDKNIIIDYIIKDIIV